MAHYIVKSDAWDFGGGKYIFVIYAPKDWPPVSINELKRLLRDWAILAPSKIEKGITIVIRDDLDVEIQSVLKPMEVD